jgi:hypothetical protein
MECCVVNPDFPDVGYGGLDVVMVKAWPRKRSTRDITEHMILHVEVRAQQ